MLNFIMMCFPKPSSIKTTEMHLFEHCLCEKIRKILNSLPEWNKGNLLIDASTTLSNVIIEFFYVGDTVRDVLLDIIDSLCFTSDDIELVTTERKLVLHESSIHDYTDEDQALNKSIELISKEVFESLYEQDCSSPEKLIGVFNLLYKNKSLVTLSNGVLNKSNALIPDYVNIFHEKPSQKSSIINNFIVGAVRRPMRSVRDIVVSQFISFVYGKNVDSLLSTIYTKDYNLYLSYTVDVALYNTYCIMFLMECNDESLKNYNMETFLSYMDFTHEYFTEQKESFKIFSALNDGYLREFAKFLCHSEVSAEVSIANYYDIIDSIKFDEIKITIQSGDLSVY